MYYVFHGKRISIIIILHQFTLKVSEKKELLCFLAWKNIKNLMYIIPNVAPTKNAVTHQIEEKFD